MTSANASSKGRTTRLRGLPFASSAALSTPSLSPSRLSSTSSARAASPQPPPPTPISIVIRHPVIPFLDQPQQLSCSPPHHQHQSKESRCSSWPELSSDTTSEKLAGGLEDEVERARGGAKAGGPETSAAKLSSIDRGHCRHAHLLLLDPRTPLPAQEGDHQASDRRSAERLAWRGRRCSLRRAAQGRARGARSSPRGSRPPPPLSPSICGS